MVLVSHKLAAFGQIGHNTCRDGKRSANMNWCIEATFQLYKVQPFQLVPDEGVKIDRKVSSPKTPPARS